MTKAHQLPRVTRTRGFTLVELLIAIVVIAILASISVVAYSGIQNRATAAKIAAGVGSYVKALKLYKVDHGLYPGSLHSRACLTADGTLPASDGFAEDECHSGLNWIRAELNADLTEYLPQLPNNRLPVVEYDDYGTEYSARSINYYPYAGNATARIYYFLPEDWECPLGYDGEWAGGATVCEVRLD